MLSILWTVANERNKFEKWIRHRCTHGSNTFLAPTPALTSCTAPSQFQIKAQHKKQSKLNNFMAEDLLNTATFDPFAADELDEAATTSTDFVDIRIQQRNGRKTLTTASGIPQEVNFEKVLKVFKKNFCCNGTIIKHPKLGNVIQLQGDQRKKIAQFLIDEHIVKKETIKIHGA